MSRSIPEILQLRAEWLGRIRRFFDSRQFLEVQTPVLSPDTVVDRYIEPIPVNVPVQGQGQVDYWLQTSPEFCLKRLLAAGAKAIYEITPAFRGGERGERHNIEFTMLEWYRVGDDYQAGMDLLDEFAVELLGCQPATRITYAEALQQFANLDVNSSEVNDELLNQRFAEQVEPALQQLGSVIIFDWPESQAALAKLRGDDPAVAERFELFVNGIELANGYHELCDSHELLKRNQHVNQLRKMDGNRALPNESRLLDAMRTGLPACSGVALGIDRMLMVATDSKSLTDVIALIE